MKERPEVLFVCVHNAGRSQMAAALLDHYAQGRVHVRSAGSIPAAEINPAVVEAMAEVGIDISKEFPKPLTDEVVRAADVVITMGCGDACPIYPGKRYEDWELDDPAERLNPAVVEVMAGVGVDLTHEFPKPLTDQAARSADVVITMGCGDACPIYPGKRYEDWELEDPDGKDLETVRKIRDQIAARVRRLVEELVPSRTGEGATA